jgi:hypothetical protein
MAGASMSARLLRCEDHYDPAALHRGILLELGDVFQLFREPLHKLETFIDVGIFATAEDDREDHFIFAGQEFFGTVDLRHEVVVANFRAEAKFFVLAVVRMALVLALLLLVFEFAEIHDSANRRFFLWRDFHQVHTDFTGLLQGLNRFDHAEQGTILSDDANRRNADLLVDPLAFLSEGYGTNSYWGNC